MWKPLENRRKREIIGWLASGMVAIATGAWAVYIHFAPVDQPIHDASIHADCSVAIAGSVTTKGSITAGNCVTARRN